MPDVRKYLQKDFLGHYDLDGRDVTLVIAAVEGGELRRPGTTETKRAPILAFERTKKRLVLNKTNLTTIGTMFGSYKSEDWIGRRITLYATKTKFGKATVDCIRVRPTVPSGAAPAPAFEAAPEVIAEMDASQAPEQGGPDAAA